MRYELDLQAPSFYVENINIQRVERERGYRHFCRNGRGKHGFIYTASGSMGYTLLSDGGKTLTVEAGRMIFIPRGCAYYSTYLEEGSEIRLIQFDLSGGMLPPYLSAPAVIDLPDAREAVDSFFAPLYGSAVKPPFYYLSRTYHLLQLIDDVYTRLPAKYQRLQAALSELTERYALSYPVSHYAALCEMSEVNFRRLFREYTGKSPVDYRNDVRLYQARIKLQSGEYNVTEAAEASGFSNLSFFIRLYKKKFGCTPKQE